MRVPLPDVESRVEALRRRATEPFRSGARRIADSDRPPTSVRAVFQMFANGGRLDLAALRLRSRVDDAIEGMVRESFEPVETAIAEEFDVETAEFDYGTKLLMPAELTLARLYRSAIDRADDGFDPVAREVRPGLLGRLPGLGSHGTGRIESEFSGLIREVDRVERTTRLVVAALLDGDMRDAINDAEFEDFEASVADTEFHRRKVAKVAQETLQEEVERRFGRFPDETRTAYEAAVDRSEAHQDEDRRFREMLEAAADGDPAARDRIREEYRDAGFEDPPEHYDEADLELPYFRTQYDRVGVIYDGMIDMYEAVGLPVDDEFRRAIVLAIIGAQVWLDDVDDFEDDMEEGQLTPVTAEYLLADDDEDAYREVLSITDRYMDRARSYAADSDSTLVGIAVEYILLSGDPGVLPGGPVEGGIDVHRGDARTGAGDGSDAAGGPGPGRSSDRVRDAALGAGDPSWRSGE